MMREDTNEVLDLSSELRQRTKTWMKVDDAIAYLVIVLENCCFCIH